MKVLAIVQARVGSTRLPGKVLADLAGAPMLVRVIERLGRSRRLDRLAVATTVEPTDAVIERLCVARGTPCVRGSEDDVLDRYYRAALELGAEPTDAIVRVTSDCPLVDPTVVDRVIDAFTRGQPAIAYASNVIPRRTFPRGLDVEVVRMDALGVAWRDDEDPARREHVTPFIYRHPDRFPLASVTLDAGADESELRFTVDTSEDLALVRRIYEHFGHDLFTWEEAAAVCRQNPAWLDLNRHVTQRGGVA
jgi:spore coat polysaccharide biosynthesis protein SpsF